MCLHENAELKPSGKEGKAACRSCGRTVDCPHPFTLLQDLPHTTGDWKRCGVCKEIVKDPVLHLVRSA